MKTEYVLDIPTENVTFPVIIVEHDPLETGIDVMAEFNRYVQIGELEHFNFRATTKDFQNFLWAEAGLDSSIK